MPISGSVKGIKTMKTWNQTLVALVFGAFCAFSVGCGLFPAQVSPPKSIFYDAISSGQGSAPSKIKLVQDSEGDFVRYWNTCQPISAAPEASAPMPPSKCDRQELLNEGMAVVDGRCAIYMARLGRAAQKAQFGTKEWSLLGGTAGAVEGLTGVAAKAISITSSAFGFGTSSSSAYSDAYLFSADIQSVQNLVASSKGNARTTIDKAISSAPTAFNSASREVVASLLKQYEQYCEVQTIHGLVNQAVNNAVVGGAKSSAPAASSGPGVVASSAPNGLHTEMGFFVQ